MEGLLIAEVLRDLAPLLPAERLAWRFPDDRTAVLPVAGDVSLWIVSRPPRPRIGLQPGAPAATPTRTPFQAQLSAHAVGPLVAVRQTALDRVVWLRFGAGEGFVPRPPIDLVVELTGRNANLILVDDRGTVVGVERQVLADRNRYRQLRPGVAYRPPPPYRKLDPRAVDDATLMQALRGRSLAEVPRLIDGVGPEAVAALAAALAQDPAEVGDVERLVRELRALVRAPAAYVAATSGPIDVAEVRAEERRQRWRAVARGEAERAVEVADKRVADAEHAIEAADDARRLRGEADLLLAHAGRVPAGASEVTLPAFEGGEASLTLDPRLDAAANARVRYDRAKRREARAARARRQAADLQRALDEARARLATVETLSDDELRHAAERIERERGRVAEAPTLPGVRFRDQRGFEVVVGRNARDNEAVTFRVARSRDVWLHAQGYRGAHVVIRSEGREVPFDTVLFAARLAAGFSEAKAEQRVAVDYTPRKHVWRVKGGAPGAVHFSQHRTVVVRPARDDAGASAAEADDGS